MYTCTTFLCVCVLSRIQTGRLHCSIPFLTFSKRDDVLCCCFLLRFRLSPGHSAHCCLFTWIAPLSLHSLPCFIGVFCLFAQLWYLPPPSFFVVTKGVVLLHLALSFLFFLSSGVFSFVPLVLPRPPLSRSLFPVCCCVSLFFLVHSRER